MNELFASLHVVDVVVGVVDLYTRPPLVKIGTPSGEDIISPLYNELISCNRAIILRYFFNTNN